MWVAWRSVQELSSIVFFVWHLISRVPVSSNRFELDRLDRSLVGEFLSPLKSVKGHSPSVVLETQSKRRVFCSRICIMCVYILVIVGSFSQVHGPLGCRCYLKIFNPWEHLTFGENVHHWIQASVAWKKKSFHLPIVWDQVFCLFIHNIQIHFTD